MSDYKFEYDRLCYAINKLFAAQEDADNNKLVQSKKMLALKMKREIIELMNPSKRIVSQTIINYESK
jgi:hypothetical protein